MELARLKTIRVVASLCFFVATSAIFLDIYNILPHKIIDAIVFLQFLPSLLSIITEPLNLSIGFIVVLILTLLFGRIYCSSICPLGTLMDFFSRIPKKTRKKKKYKYLKPLNYLRYPILAAAIITLIFNNLILINVLEPYAAFGRITVVLGEPAALFLNNNLAALLESFDYYGMYNVSYNPISFALISATASFLILILILSLAKGRLYCDALCPVGAFLSLFARFSVMKIKFSESDDCTDCGLCEKVCKANCIDYEKRRLDFDRCVVCFNCLTVCPSRGFTYGKLRETKIRKKKVSNDRRQFVVKSVAVASFVAAPVALKAQSAASDSKNQRAFPVTPPGAGSLDNFSSRCVACYLCVSACPTGVIQPTFADYGLSGLFQPKMDFRANFCNYECVRCTEVCPSGALLPLSKKEKKTTQLGTAKFLMELCVVITEGNDCGACAEHCPTKAVSMKPYGELLLPEVTPEICVGCGACEYACPTEPLRAIFVKPNEVHQKSEKPKTEKVKDDLEEDFPF